MSAPARSAAVFVVLSLLIYLIGGLLSYSAPWSWSFEYRLGGLVGPLACAPLGVFARR